MSAGVGVWLRYGDDESALQREQTIERDEAFAGMVRRQSRLMFRVAYSLLRNAHDAEDAVQEAFLKLYRGQAWRAMEGGRKGVPCANRVARCVGSRACPDSRGGRDGPGFGRSIARGPDTGCRRA